MLRILFYALMMGAFYEWHVQGIAGAGNVLHFTVCVISFCGIVGGLMMRPGDIKRPALPLWWRRACGFGDLSLVLALAWTGSFGYALAWAASAVIVAVGDTVGRRAPEKVTA